jgi:uncharacterized protein (DUF362 family)
MGSAREIGVKIPRREFERRLSAIAGYWGARKTFPAEDKNFRIALSKNLDRKAALRSALALAAPADLQGKDLYLKGNFTSDDPFPATTHPDTLRAVVELFRERDCGKITLAERSTFGSTAGIWEKLGITKVAGDLGIRLLALEDLPASRWRKKELAGSHWKRGIELPDFISAGEPIVQICNLKTHRFGGHFSASLKNSVGLIAKYSQTGDTRYNYMQELHESPDQRLMMAEINQSYSPVLVIMDATQVFVDGGPEKGEVASPGIVAVSADRVAIDAVGVALLRLYGAGPPISRGAIFQLDQLKRAAELKLGATNPYEIDFHAADDESADAAAQVKAILSETEREPRDRQELAPRRLLE